MTGDLSAEEAETIAETFQDKLQAIYDEVHQSEAAPEPLQPGFSGQWKGLTPHYSFAPVETGVPREALDRIAEATARVPEGFHLNPKMERIMAARAKAMRGEAPIDWGTGEALAFGSLLLEGTPVRLSGQDSRRGTFSHRHASWSTTRPATATIR
jgi:2-oxoglutarate dehydrogenase E1 component